MASSELASGRDTKLDSKYSAEYSNVTNFLLCNSDTS